MENTTLIPEISKWERVWHIEPEKDYYKHEFSELTKIQVDIIHKFVKEHKNYYICKEGRNTMTLCKQIT